MTIKTQQPCQGNCAVGSGTDGYFRKSAVYFCADIDQAVFIRCAGYPSGKYGTSYGCCFRTVLWCTYCDRGHDARCGENSNSFIFNVAGMWGVRILGTFICIHLLGLGLVSAWGCMIGHNMLLFVLFTLHYFSGRWNPMNKTKVSFQYKTCKK